MNGKHNRGKREERRCDESGVTGVREPTLHRSSMPEYPLRLKRQPTLEADCIKKIEIDPRRDENFRLTRELLSSYS